MSRAMRDESSARSTSKGVGWFAGRPQQRLHPWTPVDTCPADPSVGVDVLGEDDPAPRVCVFRCNADLVLKSTWLVAGRSSSARKSQRSPGRGLAGLAFGVAWFALRLALDASRVLSQEPLDKQRHDEPFDEVTHFGRWRRWDGARVTLHLSTARASTAEVGKHDEPRDINRADAVLMRIDA